MTTPEWRVPKPLDTVEIEATGGARIILRRHGDVKGPRLILSHDNGLAIDLYYPFWSRLQSRFELIVYDLRSHGRNPTADLAHHNVATFTADEARIRAGIEEHFGAKPAVGVFHSLSAMVALNHDPPGRGYAGLVLFDPPMYLADGDHYGIDTLWRRLGMLARHRQPRFATREEFAEEFRRSWVFEFTRPGVESLAADVLLEPASDGDGYELRCPREYEAQVFDYGFAYAFEPDTTNFACPVTVIGGDPGVEFSSLPSVDLEGLIGWDYDFIPHTTHFLQLENPEECVSTMIAFLEREGLA